MIMHDGIDRGRHDIGANIGRRTISGIVPLHGSGKEQKSHKGRETSQNDQ